MKRSVFDLPEFAPLRARWDDRVRELARRKSYYDGSVYTKTRRAQLQVPRLYRGIHSLYLPLARAVDVDAGIVPGAWTLSAEFRGQNAERLGSAVPLSAHHSALITLFDSSRWQTAGLLYVHYGAMYGCSGLKVSDLRDRQRVIISPVDPTRFMLVGAGAYDSTPALAIFAEHRAQLPTDHRTHTSVGAGLRPAQADHGPTYEYAEVITPEWVRTFVDGEPAGFDGRPPEYPNALGFVPLVEVPHIQSGDSLGECTFQKAIPLLDEVNELASYLADIIKKHAEPQWAVVGAEPSDLVKSGDNVWFIPAGGDAKPLVAPIDVAGVLAFVQEIRDQVHGSLPELAFEQLVRKDQVATATLELQLMELVLKVKRVRPNYDRGLADALRMAGRAAKSMLTAHGHAPLREIAALDDEALAFDSERPVLPLDPITRLTVAKMQQELKVEG